MNVLGLVNYWAFIFLMMVGFYILISQGNLIKKIVGLSIFQPVRHPYTPLEPCLL